MSAHLQPLPPPRAAAFAGILFSLLLGATLVIIRLAAPGQDSGLAAWTHDPLRRNSIRAAIRLAPFAGIAFLWFIGVLRNRLGDLEDRFFATVFFGSGLLFVASLFASAAMAGALMESIAHNPDPSADREVYYLARQLVSASLNVFGIKMAGVFIFSTCMIILRSGILPRWVAWMGILCGVALLLIITDWPWVALLFPIWTLVVSVRTLMAERQSGR